MEKLSQREKRRNPLVVILGPTSSGKSSLAVRLAKQFHGEVVSADSRQIYKGLNIGTGKITRKEMAGIPHHLLDIASPAQTFTVARYQKKAIETIQAIRAKDKIPFLVGGSPLYIYAVTDGFVFPKVKPNPALRRRMEKLSTQSLFIKLLRLDPRRAKIIERKNKRRLIRALEIILATGRPVPRLTQKPLPCPMLFLGIKVNRVDLKRLIAKRLHKRFRQGMIQEVRTLRKKGLSWTRLENLGLEYRYIARFLRGKLSLNEMKLQLQKAIEDFARRQMSWFKKDPRIHWIQHQKEAQRLILKSLP